MANKLPQNEEDQQISEDRKDHLQKMQSKYEYAYDYAETIAVVRKVPCREFPGLYYFFRGGMNLLLLIPSLPHIIITFLRYLLDKPLESYQDYIFYPLSPQPNPDIADNFQQDLLFGLQRVIGVNPAVIRAVTEKTPLPEKLPASEIQQVFEQQINELSYASAVKQKRIYFLDYAVLDILQQNPGEIDGGQKQHITTPIIVLFMQPDGMLRPIAIQLYQEAGPDNPIYTPEDGNLWLAAKTFAQIADGNHHILYTHAPRIHYVMEAIIMASHRQLHTSHPLFTLLNPHLKITLTVNHQHTFLKNRKGRPGRFGELFAGDYDATTQCMADAMTSFNFRESAFPIDIASREVDNPDLFYPFRDDGMLLWEATQNFAHEYINIYYQSDADVSNDYELQNWAHDMTAQDRGRIQGFNNTFESKDELAKTIGHIIFLCTSYHSCIHFNQYRFPGFVPNMPYSGYIEPPKGKDSEIDVAELFKIQPAFKAANSQTWTYFLTNYQVNKVGQYDLEPFDPNAQEVIKQYQNQLNEIEQQINERNSTRPVSYDRMMPSKTPNSVTV